MALEQARPRTGETVTVICRMPSGIILDLYEADALKDHNAAQVFGSVPQPKQTVRLRGAKHDPRFHRRDNVLLGMGGRTEVERDFWEAWKKQNENFAPLKSGLIFAEANEARAVAALADRRDERTGFEGCNQDKLPGVTPFAKDED